MSFQAINATYTEVVPVLTERLHEVEASRRPEHSKVTLVAFVLADKYRDRRGFVNESVAQVAEAVGLTERQVRTCLGALDELGLWKRVGSGNRHAPAKRIPTFLERQAEPSPNDDDRATGEPVDVEGLERQVERQVSGLERQVGAPRATGQPVDTPTQPPVTTPSLSDDDERLIRNHIARHIDFNRMSITDPAAIRRTQRPDMVETVLTAKRLGLDPATELEALWSTGPAPDDLSFDLAETTKSITIPQPPRWVLEDTEDGRPLVRNAAS